MVRSLRLAVLLAGLSALLPLGAVAQEASGSITEEDGVIGLPPITVITSDPAPARKSRPTQAAGAGGRSGSAAPRQAAAPTAPVTAPAPRLSPVSTVTESEIEREQAQSFGDIFFATPGATSTSFAPGASRPVLRGLEGNRIRIQEGGIGIQDVSALGEDHAVPIDPLALQNVQIVRGPQALRYGSESVGGVVDADAGRIPYDLTPDTSLLVIDGAHTTVDDGLEGSLRFDNRSGNVAVHVDAFGRNAEDYDTPLGIQENSFVETDGQAAGTTLFFDRGFIGTSVSRFASNYGIPGGEEAELGIHIDMEQIRWTNHGEYRPLDGPVQSVRFWLGYSDYTHDEIGLEHEHAHEHEDGEEEEHAEEHEHEHEHEHEEVVHGTFGRKAWEGRVELAHVPVGTALGPLNGTLGFQWSHDDLLTEGEAAEFLAPNTTQEVAAYLIESLPLTERLRLEAAARIESSHVDGFAPIVPADLLPPPDEIPTRASSKSFAPISGSIGLVRDLPRDVVGRLTAQYAERAPTAAELFSKGSHHASGTFEIGDPGLGIEAAKSAEIGLARVRGPFRFDANAYATQFDGFIHRDLTGITCDEEFASCGIPDGEFDQVLISQQDARFTGAELKAERDLGLVAGGIFGVSGRYDFVHAKFEDGSYVPRLPPHRLGGGLYWQDEHWRAETTWLHAFDQDEIATFEDPTPGYDLWNAALSWTGQVRAPYVKQLTLGVAAQNLLDDEIRNSVSFKSDEVLLPGRSFKAFARAVF